MGSFQGHGNTLFQEKTEIGENYCKVKMAATTEMGGTPIRRKN